MKTERLEQAITVLLKALSINPNDTWVKTNLGFAFLKQSNSGLLRT